ncbi:MAG TPA: biotin/lipoate A/B protein ligase family protein [Burkholderiaceae bacterium]
MRRSLAHATSWRDYDWLLVHAKAVPPVTHIALDEVLARRVAAGRRPPTLRIWEWDESAVVIGCFQSVRNEVDPVQAERYGFDVVRRISGGGAMLMEKGAIITYSLYAPEALVAGMSFIDSYAFLDDWVLAALRSLGIDAGYKPLNDIVGPHGKIGGAAQRRFRGVVLHHATLAYDMDNEKLTHVLRIGREKLSDKGITSAAKRVDPLRSQTGLSRAAIIERFAETFTQRYGAAPGEISADEYAQAEELVRTKFATHDWLYRVP